MTELAKYEVYYKKLNGICEENGLVFSFKKNVYPIRLTVRPTQDANEQMTMLEMADEKGYTSPDAYLSFYMKDGELIMKTGRTLTMSETLIAELRNLYKNLSYLWLQYFHRDMTSGRIEQKMLPDIQEDPETMEDLDDLDVDELDIPDDDDLLEEKDDV